ncbi:unnamed protein product [Echinostoma caproni]|uniref:Hexosyltransferase n=1 Tax=Echinostoma caproni TaxID=27848 RepID=A0A183AYT3_9TREM|nr:unnamed protein product [Echinostoma caproni]
MADEYDYFFKGDDDTFVIYENLELLLKTFSPGDKVHTGFPMKDRSNELLYSGGAGYILSSSALKAIVIDGLGMQNRMPKCETSDGPEDVRIGRWIYHKSAFNKSFFATRRVKNQSV